MRQEMMGANLVCSGISCAICKQSAPHSRQITAPTPHRSTFYRLDALPDTVTNSVKALKSWDESRNRGEEAMTGKWERDGKRGIDVQSS